LSASLVIGNICLVALFVKLFFLNDKNNQPYNYEKLQCDNWQDIRTYYNNRGNLVPTQYKKKDHKFLVRGLLKNEKQVTVKLLLSSSLGMSVNSYRYI
jgi:hypothetical protein